jgi:hypothetical protein
MGPGSDDPEVYLLLEPHQAVRASEVRRIDVETLNTGWVLGGALLGLLVDGAVVAVVCSSYHPVGSSFGNWGR